MKTKARFAILVLILCLVITLAWRPSQAQTSVQRYFPETGHTVKGEFLNAYERVTNPLLLYGFPITESFVDPIYGTLQYFQKARFELHPELPAGQRVQVSTLGKYLYQPGPSLPSGEDPNACRQFPNGYQVCLAFLDFYDANGGGAGFGWPISKIGKYKGRSAQYFEKTRFEWPPEFPFGQRVALGEVNLPLAAVPGAGILLGNLRCGVAGLLDGFPAGGLGGLLTNLLNAIVDLLNGLLGA